MENHGPPAPACDHQPVKYTGGPRNLTQTLEGSDLCVAYKQAQQPSLTQFLERYGKENQQISLVEARLACAAFDSPRVIAR